MRSNKKRARPNLRDWAGVAKTVKEFGTRGTIYSQGDIAKTVLYTQEGGVKLSAASKNGKEAVVAILGPGEFFGEGCLAGQHIRTATATATISSTILIVRKNEILRLLQTKHPFCGVFMSYLLARNLRIEEDLIDHICHSSERRLARALLLLSGNGNQHKPHRFAEISQATLARMVGTTRSRVNFFMNKFRKRGFIKYNGTFEQNGGLQIHSSLLSVALHE
jgi:CRP/FNR family cyclic AMP-dependent transcriptional regulator